MKIGVRKPSLKKSFKARTTAKAKRRIKKAINPLYGKKGMGLLNNPKKAIYNKVYNKTTVSLFKPAKKKRRKKSYSSKKTYKTTSKVQNQEPLSFDDAGSVFPVLLGTFVDIVISFNVLLHAGVGRAIATFAILFLLIMIISSQIDEKKFVLSDYIIIAAIAGMTALCFKVGFWKGLLITAGILIVIFVVAVILEVVKDTDESSGAEQLDDVAADTSAQDISYDRSEQIPYLYSLLEEFNKHKEIVNTSRDPDTVKQHLDCWLGVMDEIMTFDDALLREVGMAKAHMASNKEKVLELYNVMIEQARENSKQEDDSADKQSKVETEPQPVSSEEGIIPLEALLKVAVPSKQGLYPHEILMLHYANAYKVSGDNRFQSFWRYQYSVEEPQSVLDSLQSRGFLTTGDLRSALERCKVTELKAQLQTLGEKTTGKKAELIDRLLNSGNNEYLEEQFSDRYYALTDSGTEELTENEYVVYLHKTGSMSVWEMNQRLSNNPDNFSYRDILWRSFNEQAEQHFIDADMGLYRNVRLSMYQFLMEEDRVRPAFGHLCEVIAYDLSSMDNWEEHNPTPEMLKLKVESALKYCFPYTGSQVSLPPMVIKWAAEMQHKLGMSDGDYRAALLEQFEKIHLLRRIFTNEECADIVMNEIGNHPRKLAAIYKQAEERLKQEYESMT